MNRRELLKAAGLGVAGLGALSAAGGLETPLASALEGAAPSKTTAAPAKAVGSPKAAAPSEAANPSRAAASSQAANPSKAADPYKGLKVGVTSYTLRRFSLDETIRIVKELGLKYIALKDVHLKMTLTKEELQAAARKIKDAGLTLMGGGVVYLGKEEAAARKGFEYARDAGMPLISASFDPTALPMVEKLSKEFNIRVAIHNHGPGDTVFPSALGAYEKIKGMDKRMGLCVDVGHTVRQGEKEVETIRAVQDRILDFHIKDVNRRDAKGTTVVMGKGVIDLPGVFKALLEMKYPGHVALEYENDTKDLVADVAECFAYIRKTLGKMKQEG
jgi:sugar phosphate isomerase/epimerase